MATPINVKPNRMNSSGTGKLRTAGKSDIDHRRTVTRVYLQPKCVWPSFPRQKRACQFHRRRKPFKKWPTLERAHESIFTHRQAGRSLPAASSTLRELHCHEEDS